MAGTVTVAPGWQFVLGNRVIPLHRGHRSFVVPAVSRVKKTLEFTTLEIQANGKAFIDNPSMPIGNLLSLSNVFWEARATADGKLSAGTCALSKCQIRFAQISACVTSVCTVAGQTNLTWAASRFAMGSGVTLCVLRGSQKVTVSGTTKHQANIPSYDCNTICLSYSLLSCWPSQASLH